jgi:hypothetical protein
MLTVISLTRFKKYSSTTEIGLAASQTFIDLAYLEIFRTQSSNCLKVLDKSLYV